MDWSNEKALEFLQFFQTEPCLWDPRLKSYKNRLAQSEAWRRILQALPFSITLEELKKKKESLMGYYRIHLNKYKKSLKSGPSPEDVYMTNWFAFDKMNSFLKPIYLNNSIIQTELSSQESTPEKIISAKKVDKNKLVPENIPHTDNLLHNECKSTKNYPIEKNKRPHIQYKKSESPEIISHENQTDGAFDCLKTITSKQKEDLDEYDYFAGVIANKIRKIENMDDREQLMNLIQNLIFEFYMKSKHKNSPTQTMIQPKSSPIYIQCCPSPACSTTDLSPTQPTTQTQCALTNSSILQAHKTQQSERSHIYVQSSTSSIDTSSNEVQMNSK